MYEVRDNVLGDAAVDAAAYVESLFASLTVIPEHRTAGYPEVQALIFEAPQQVVRLPIDTPLVRYVLRSVGLDDKRVLRCKINRQGKVLRPEGAHNAPHVDQGYPVAHKVVLYYLNDTDGDTVLFNERYFTPLRRVTEAARIAPKFDRALVFDGSHYHTGSHPVAHAHRTVLNINVAS